jgi:hypothetical protein
MGVGYLKTPLRMDLNWISGPKHGVVGDVETTSILMQFCPAFKALVTSNVEDGIHSVSNSFPFTVTVAITFTLPRSSFTASAFARASGRSKTTSCVSVFGASTPDRVRGQRGQV